MPALVPRRKNASSPLCRKLLIMKDCKATRVALQAYSSQLRPWLRQARTASKGSRRRDAEPLNRDNEPRGDMPKVGSMLYTAQTRLSVATALFCGSGGKVESDPTFLEKSSLTLISGKSSLTYFRAVSSATGRRWRV